MTKMVIQGYMLEYSTNEKGDSIISLIIGEEKMAIYDCHDSFTFEQMETIRKTMQSLIDSAARHVVERLRLRAANPMVTSILDMLEYTKR